MLEDRGQSPGVRFCADFILAFRIYQAPCFNLFYFTLRCFTICREFFDQTHAQERTASIDHQTAGVSPRTEACYASKLCNAKSDLITAQI
tara:strand:- start:219 stop:488 length:270 start_codon:yes stop_codon:yes gene_type:complete